MAFSIAFVIGLVFWFKQGRQLSFYAQLPWRVLAIGRGRTVWLPLFFTSSPCKMRPPVEASLNRLSLAPADCAAVLLFAGRTAALVPRKPVPWPGLLEPLY